MKAFVFELKDCLNKQDAIRFERFPNGNLFVAIASRGFQESVELEPDQVSQLMGWLKEVTK